MSNNTLLLHRILEKLDSLETRMISLEKRVTNLEDIFTKYINNESDIQENSDLEYLYNYCQINLPSLNTSKCLLKYFFLPSGGTQYTDWDGCLILTFLPNQPKHVNGYKNNSLGFNPNTRTSKAIITESKHGLTKQRLDKKIIQFSTMFKVLDSILENTIQNPAPIFTSMVTTYNLRNFPKERYILFSSDDLDSFLRTYILELNNGITEEKYNIFCFNIFKNSKLYNKIIEDKDIVKKIKNKIERATSILEIKSIFENNSNELVKYYNNIKIEYESYSVLEPFYTSLRGKLGVMQFGQIVLSQVFLTMNSLR
jgi:hypothetical protein